jgi:sugar transferase (PEP-CTERM system associated)
MWQALLRYLAFRAIATVLLEHVLLVICVIDAASFRRDHGSITVPELLKAILVALVFQIFLHLRDVYDLSRTRSTGRFFGSLGQALLLGIVSLLVLSYLFPGLLPDAETFPVAVAFIGAFLTLWHILVRLWVHVRAPVSNILVLGTGVLARELVTEILKRPDLGMGVRGFVGQDPSLLGVSLVNPKVIGLYDDLTELVERHNVNEIVVALNDRRGNLPIDTLLTLKTQGIAVEEATSVYERVTGKIAIENLKPSWLIFNAGFQVSRGLLLQKRLLSIVISLVLLLMFLPLMVLVMILVKLESPGPAFHKQERVGQGGRTFTIWKFRSMYQDAEKHTGPTWAQKNDKRVTKVGRLLRRTRLDELPQLYNVLRGDMSLVGPRPERPHFVQDLAEKIPFYQLRHAVKPGVTGWAQVKYEYGNSVQDSIEKLQYDLFYIKHMSCLLDIIVIFETAKTVLFRQGS